MNNRANILLVEDDQINQLVASTFLRNWGIQVVIANNGAEAITLILSKAFQLVLMDIHMPVMDGFESTSRIREMDDTYFKTIPIIAFTASGLIDVQQKVASYGMNDFITKPLIADEIQSKINKYLPSLHRPLLIDFDAYTDGDPDFKKELISLLIGNIKELQQSLVNSTQNASNFFLRILHKVKSTIEMLCDHEFIEALEEIKTLCVHGHMGENYNKKLNHFNGLCSKVIESLYLEGVNTKATKN